MCRKEVKIKEKKRKEKTTRSRYLGMYYLLQVVINSLMIFVKYVTCVRPV